MKIIVGLGNPGEKYLNTRHNLGFEALDSILKKFESVKNSTWEESKKTKSLIKKVNIKDIPTLLAKPQTFMNNSGEGVKALLNYYKIDITDLILIHDELDLPLGKLQIRFGGGTAGHNGVESVINNLSTNEFLRIRMGIGKPKKIPQDVNPSHHTSTENYVLGYFDDNEHHHVKTMIKHIERELPLILKHGYKRYISQYNKK